MTTLQPNSPERPSSGRRSRTFSFRSDRSSDSIGSKPKVSNLHEESRDKKRLAADTKANPNRAIAEAQPIEIAHNPTTLKSIRNMQWKDTNGNVITDPDSSNPTRPRLERPLDTIRSFEAAIDSGYKRRNPSQRNDSSDAATSYSRPVSVMGGPDHYNSRPYNGGSGAYRASSYRQDYYPSNGSSMRPNHYRQTTAPAMMSQGNYDQGPAYYRESYDTVNTGGSSGSPSEPWGNSTDPSSENSSLDRTHYGNRQEYNDAYGSPYGMPMKDAIQEEYGFDGQNYPEQQQYQPPPQPPYRNPYTGGNDRMNAPPPPPKHAAFQPQQPASNVIPLSGPPRTDRGPAPGPNNGSSRLTKVPSRPQPARQQSQEKPKGWLKKRFSRG